MALSDLIAGITGNATKAATVAKDAFANPQAQAVFTPEAQAVIDKFTLAGQRVQEKTEAITQSAKEQAAELKGKLGVRSTGPEDAAALANNLPSARETVAALDKARQATFAAMDNPLAGPTGSTRWQDTVRPGQAQQPENVTGAPQDAQR